MDSTPAKSNVLRNLQQLSIRGDQYRGDQYKQTGLTAEAVIASHRSQATEASRNSRDQLLRAKRLRQAPHESVSFDACQTAQPESPSTKITQLVKTISAVTSTPRDRHKAVCALRRLLSSGDAPLLAAAEVGAGSCLAKCLIIRQYNAVELKTVFEAAWAITNMAAGPPKSVAAVLPAAPVLILLLCCTSTHVAEQSAWGLGNMAGESAALRSRLQANGAVKPLLQLVLTAEGCPERRTLSAACTAAWALSNLLQDQSHATKEVFAVPGGAEGLVRLLGSSSNMELLVEIAWVICHATHSQADANRLVHLGLVQPAVRQIHACVLQAQSGEEGVLAVLGLLTPLLRTLANVAALGGHDACSELLSSPACDCIITLAAMSLASQDVGLQAEAARLCASVAAMPHKEKESRSHRGQQALQPLLPALLDVFLYGAVHAQTEAAYAFANLLVGKEAEDDGAVKVAQMLVQQEALAALQMGLRSVDKELVMVVLHLVSMVSKLQPMCRPDMSVMLTDDLKVLTRKISPIQAAAVRSLQALGFTIVNNTS